MQEANLQTDAKTFETESLISELDGTTKEFLRVLSSFNADAFNKARTNGGWSPALVAEHMRKSYHWVVQLLQGATAPTERDPAKNVERIKNYFLDLTIKMQSPDFVVPENKAYDKDVLIASLSEDRNRILELAQTSKLSETCLDFQFPVIGALTGIEALAFVVYHTQRHMQQLKQYAE